MKTLFVVAAAFLSSVVTVSAQETGRIVVAADSSSGTYNKMLTEIIGVCSTDDFNIVVASGVTGGAPGNLDALYNNKAQAAFLHSDVYFANAQADPTYAKFQTLVALYKEPIHVLALRVSKSKKPGMMSFGTQEFNSLSDMKGYAVGAAGGGVYTARILTGQGEGGFAVTPYNTGQEVIDALTAGTIAGAIFVGAAPLPNLEKLNPQLYKLIPIGDVIGSKVKGVYRPATINYNGLTTGPISTMAPMATLLTRKYSTDAKVTAQRHLRECFNSNLDKLKDEGSSNWQDVEAGDHGVLPWYDLPAATPIQAKTTKR
jgi:TRAP-type uncharacterized transport system substrate-binding protein